YVIIYNMNQKFIQRRAFLSEKKEKDHRITIGFTGIADLRSFIGQEFIAGILRAAEDYDINFINMSRAIKFSVYDDVDFMTTFRHNLKFMRSPLIDGMVTWASSFNLFSEKDRIIKMFAELAPLPMVDIGSFDLPGTPSIRIDNSISIKQIFDHLTTEHKYTKFAFVGVEDNGPHKRRFDFFRKELQDRGLEEIPDSAFFMKNMTPSQINLTVDKILERFELSERTEIDAIITSSDTIASQLIEILNRRGVFVPRDVAVTGYNNWHDGITSLCPVTTIDLEVFKRGYTAVEVLIDRIIEQENLSKKTAFSNIMSVQNILIPTKLIVRESCGCLETCVNDNYLSMNEISPISSDLDSGEELRIQAEKQAQILFPEITEDHIHRFVHSLFNDIYQEKRPASTLLWFQIYLQECRKRRNLDGEKLQSTVSALRKLVIPALKELPESMLRMENIFHQMRSMISVFLKYESLSDRENPYTLNDISQIAIDFDSATSKTEFLKMLNDQLPKLEIPGAVLALNEKMSFSFNETRVEYVFPPKKDFSPSERITQPELFPKNYFPQNRRYSLSLEILNIAGRYFGYAFFEIKNLNVAIYDTARMLLSKGLFSAYEKEGLNPSSNYEISREQINDVADYKTEDDSKRTRLTSKQITNYLLENIGEMTNLQKMADYFMVSKSYLTRKTKEVTGLSVQTFHEKLKIEQAKNMLSLGTFTMEEIAGKLGFQNKNYFSNVFKKNTGLSPRNWIKKNK
ncbi:MAG: substrate-binding domain-containing protein, partial [Treponema sp.]|nr:substrate-binding domain-containing protein [Candidatus Treponema equifaecale]